MTPSPTRRAGPAPPSAAATSGGGAAAGGVAACLAALALAADALHAALDAGGGRAQATALARRAHAAVVTAGPDFHRARSALEHRAGDLGAALARSLEPALAASATGADLAELAVATAPDAGAAGRAEALAAAHLGLAAAAVGHAAVAGNLAVVAGDARLAAAAQDLRRARAALAALEEDLR